MCVLKLCCSFDGFRVVRMEEVVRTIDILITCTGRVAFCISNITWLIDTLAASPTVAAVETGNNHLGVYKQPYRLLDDSVTAKAVCACQFCQTG